MFFEPITGLVAAASGKAELEEQIEQQKVFKPPHPEHAMVSEAELKAGSKLKEVSVTDHGEGTRKAGMNGTVTPEETRE